MSDIVRNTANIKLGTVKGNNSGMICIEIIMKLNNTGNIESGGKSIKNIEHIIWK